MEELQSNILMQTDKFGKHTELQGRWTTKAAMLTSAKEPSASKDLLVKGNMCVCARFSAKLGSVQDTIS